MLIHICGAGNSILLSNVDELEKLIFVPYINFSNVLDVAA